MQVTVGISEGQALAYYRGSNGYLKMSHIIDEARALLGEEKLREALSCIAR